jgi:hypothetical protein
MEYYLAPIRPIGVEKNGLLSIPGSMRYLDRWRLSLLAAGFGQAPAAPSLNQSLFEIGFEIGVMPI